MLAAFEICFCVLILTFYQHSTTIWHFIMLFKGQISNIAFYVPLPWCFQQWSYKNNSEFPVNKKTIPVLTCPICLIYYTHLHLCCTCILQELVVQHILARVYTLICLPVFVYCFIFVIHFVVLNKRFVVS